MITKCDFCPYGQNGRCQRPNMRGYYDCMQALEAYKKYMMRKPTPKRHTKRVNINKTYRYR